MKHVRALTLASIALSRRRLLSIQLDPIVALDATCQFNSTFFRSFFCFDFLFLKKSEPLIINILMIVVISVVIFLAVILIIGAFGFFSYSVVTGNTPGCGCACRPERIMQVKFFVLKLCKAQKTIRVATCLIVVVAVLELIPKEWTSLVILLPMMLVDEALLSKNVI